MPNVLNEYPSDGVSTSFEVSMLDGYLDRNYVKFYIRPADNLLSWEPYDLPVTWVGPYTFTIQEPIPDGTVLVCMRETSRNPIVDFENTSRITERNLNTAFKQSLHRTVELEDWMNRSTQVQANAATLALAAAQEAAESALTSAQAAEAAAGLVSAAETAAQTAADYAAAADAEAQAATDTAENALALIEAAIKGNVDSFNGRDGAVVPESGDYTPSMVGFNIDGMVTGVPAWDAVPAWSDPNLNGQVQALVNRTEKLKADLQVVPGSALTTTPEWSDVPTHSDPSLDAQAQALANRTESLHKQVVRVARSFGSKGDWDGVTGTDDRVAVQAALDSFGPEGGILRFTRGRYLINSYGIESAFTLLMYPSNITIQIDAGAEVVVGPFFDDKRFQLFAAKDSPSLNPKFTGKGKITFCGATNQMRTAYVAPRLAIQAGSALGFSLDGINFEDGDLSNCVAVGAGRNGDMATVREASFTNLVQDGTQNHDFTACYMNALRSTVVDCHFKNTTRKGAEIACAVELHKSNSVWRGGTIEGYTRGAYLVAAPGESEHTKNVEICGVKGSVTNNFVAYWVSDNCVLTNANVHANIVAAADRDETMNDPALYGVACFVASAGGTVNTSSNFLRAFNNQWSVPDTVPDEFSTVFVIDRSVTGWEFFNNNFSTKHLVWMPSGNAFDIVSLRFVDNNLNVDAMVDGSVYAHLHCNSLTACEISLKLSRPRSLNTLLKVEVADPDGYNSIKIHPDCTTNLNKSLDVSSAFIQQGTNIVQYPTDASINVPATVGVGVIQTVDAIPGISKAEVVSTGTLPADGFYPGVLTKHVASDTLAAIAMLSSNSPGVYYARLLLSNVE